MRNSTRIYNPHAIGLKFRGNGSAIVELVAALMLLIPLLIFVCLAAVETTQICMVKAVLNQCASTAARRLAIAYAENPSSAIANPDTTFSSIRFSSIIVSNTQFNVPPGAAGWNTYGSPPTVTVEVSFNPTQLENHGYPIIDPLFIGKSISISSTATALLE